MCLAACAVSVQLNEHDSIRNKEAPTMNRLPNSQIVANIIMALIVAGSATALIEVVRGDRHATAAGQSLVLAQVVAPEDETRSGTLILKDESSRRFELEGESEELIAPEGTDLQRLDRRRVEIEIDDDGNVSEIREND
jgi:hypothetical protein